MGHAASIEAKLRAALRPLRLEIVNESALHKGHHAHFDGTGETHLRVRIVAEAFGGMTRLQRHRTVNELAADEIRAGLHALAIEARTPAEAGL